MTIYKICFVLIITFNTFFLLKKKKKVLSTYRKKRTELLNHDYRLPPAVQDFRLSGVFMLPTGRSKNYSRSYEFRQIIGPLNEHRQNKQILVRFLKFEF